VVESLALTLAALHGEPWRLWTGHAVHYDTRHVLLDAVAALPPIALSVRHRHLIAWAFVVAPLISIAILLTTPNVEYRGMSALVVGLWILVPLRSIHERSLAAAALLILCITKLAFEAFTPFRLGFTPTPPLFLAHWSGALAGAMTFALTRLR
jgi:rhomboid family GlyGly-CTERM serine protease